MANEFANVNYLEKIKKLTLFDAILFRKAFDLNIPAAESLLRTIMENDKIKVARSIKKQRREFKLCAL